MPLHFKGLKCCCYYYYYHYNKALPLAESLLTQQSLADPEACVPNIAASAGRRLQDSHWDASDAQHRCQSSAESEAKYTHSQQVLLTMYPASETWTQLSRKINQSVN